MKRVFYRITGLIVLMLILSVTACDIIDIFAKKACFGEDKFEKEEWLRGEYEGGTNGLVGHLWTRDNVGYCGFSVEANDMCLESGGEYYISLKFFEEFPDWCGLTAKDLVIKGSYTISQYVDELVEAKDVFTPSYESSNFDIAEHTYRNTIGLPSSLKPNYPSRMTVSLELSLPEPEPEKENPMPFSLFQQILYSVVIIITYKN